jgi:membrane protein
VATTADNGDAPPPEPKQSRRGRIEGWVRGRQARLEEARTTSATVGVAFDALSYDTDTGAPVLAAALGFRVFLFQVPSVCLFVILAGIYSDATGTDVSSVFHGKGMAHLTALSVSSAAELSGWARVTALVLAAYATFLAARSLIKVLNIVHALVWDVPRTRLRNANRAALAFIALAAALVAISLGISMLQARSTPGGITLLSFSLVGQFAVWWWVSWRLPHRDCPPVALAPGAAVFAVGVELLDIATVIWFPHHIASKSQVYGAIGVALAMLLWAYLLGRVITIAVVLDAAIWARFGTGSANPIHVRRPPWRVPLIDDKVSRIWVAAFGDDESQPLQPRQDVSPDKDRE